MPTAAESGDAFWKDLEKKQALVPAERSRLLRDGAITHYELVPWGSNYTFMVALADDAGEPQGIGIYKPQQGEAPLWDFPDGTLYQREYAAYLLSNWLGWGLVPETIVREDGPYGVGTIQDYVVIVPDSHYFALKESDPDALRQMAVFDLITNNADRKAGHMFKGIDGQVYGIDHGLTFNTQPKLRTVIWDFVGEPIPQALLDGLCSRLNDARAVAVLREQLAPLLTRAEIDRFLTRAERLAKLGVYPGAGGGNSHYIPWGFI